LVEPSPPPEIASVLLLHLHSFEMATELPTVKSRLKGNYTTTTCVHCKTSIEYIPPSTAPPSDFLLECAQCKQTWIIRPAAQDASKGRKAAGRRKIGTGSSCLRFTHSRGGRSAHDEYTQTRSRSRRSTTTCVAAPRFPRLILAQHADLPPHSPTVARSTDDVHG
jgi:hypothetical protein